MGRPKVSLYRLFNLSQRRLWRAVPSVRRPRPCRQADSPLYVQSPEDRRLDAARLRAMCACQVMHYSASLSRIDTGNDL